MGTISTAFAITTQALDVDQAALNVVANNVANANTAGYTTETATFVQNSPIEVNGVSSGDGVSSGAVTSARDSVLSERLNQQQQVASSTGARLTALDTVQALFTPNSGSSTASAGDISSGLTGFFSSLSSLEANPTDSSLRDGVLSSASTLAADVSSAAGSLNSQKSALDQEASGVTSQVNTLTSAIAQLNVQIQSSSGSGGSNTLEDQRSQDVSQLSKLIGINQITTENNGISVTTTAGQTLVSEGQSTQLTTGIVSGLTHFYVGGTDVTTQLASGGGELGGDLTARDQDIPNVLASLDQLAYSVSTQVNTLNNAGTDLAGDNANAGNIFSAPTQVAGSAAAMSVVMTDPNHVAAAGTGLGTGDSSNATAMAALQNQTIVNGKTPTNYYANFVSQLGSTVSNVETENTAATASVTQLQTQSDSLTTVNENDQASIMANFERSYQSAAKVFTMLDTLMASVLNLGSQTTVS
jgi:flagellar hook-associated protein 1 FlgK